MRGYLPLERSSVSPVRFERDPPCPEETRTLNETLASSNLKEPFITHRKPVLFLYSDNVLI